jgi:hypothetical protein
VTPAVIQAIESRRTRWTAPWRHLFLVFASFTPLSLADETLHQIRDGECLAGIEYSERWNSLRLRITDSHLPLCRLDEEQTLDLMSTGLAELARAHPSVSVDALGLGRIEQLPWLSRRLVEQARRDPEWRTIRERKAWTRANDYVRQTLSRAETLTLFEPALTGQAYRGTRVSCEKVLISTTRAKAIPDWVKDGPPLPYDGICWLGLERSQTPALDEPREIVDQFYLQVLKDNVRGLPDITQQARLARFFGVELTAALEQARAQQAAFVNANPGDRPPWVEGSLFTSLFEGPTGFRVGEETITAEGRQVLVAFEYAPAGSQQAPVAWKDRVWLQIEGGRWVIQDIELLGDWAFKSGERLRDLLPLAQGSHDGGQF